MRLCDSYRASIVSFSSIISPLVVRQSSQIIIQRKSNSSKSWCVLGMSRHANKSFTIKSYENSRLLPYRRYKKNITHATLYTALSHSFFEHWIYFPLGWGKLYEFYDVSHGSLVLSFWYTKTSRSQMICIEFSTLWSHSKTFFSLWISLPFYRDCHRIHIFLRYIYAMDHTCELYCWSPRYHRHL